MQYMLEIWIVSYRRKRRKRYARDEMHAPELFKLEINILAYIQSEKIKEIRVGAKIQFLLLF